MKFVVRHHRGADGNRRAYVYYWCAGCGHAHSVPAERWHWNGSIELPTLSPSVRHYYTKPGTNEEVTTCHYRIKNGQIKYCGDCPHKLSGQNMPLQEIPEDYGIPDDQP